jgi:rod shape-determining protein MreC
MLRRILPFLIVAVVLIGIPTLFIDSVRNSATKTSAPTAHFLTRQRLAVQGFFENISQLGSLKLDKNTLQTEVLKLQQEVARLENIEQENVSLRRELGVTGVVKTTDKVFARIVVQGADPLDRSFTIDAGSNQGLAVGQPVVHQGYLVGRIISVRKDSSIVRSIVSPKSIIQAWTIGNQQLGIVVGDGNTASLREIDQGIVLDSGLMVETSGLSGGVTGSLPQGISLGTITSSLSVPSDLKQTFRMNLGIDPASIEDVMVLLIPVQ